MLIFILSLLSLTSSILIIFIQSIPKKVLTLSILSIVLILLNLINQLDIIISPPSYNPYIINNQHKTIRISFVQEIKNQQMINMAQEIQLIKKNLLQKKSNYQYINGFIQLFDSRTKQVYQQSFVTKEENYFIQRLINGLKNYHDQIITLEGVHKARIEILIKIYLNKIKTSGIQRNAKISIINQKTSSWQPYVYLMPRQSLKQGNAHYIFVLTQPCDSLLSFLYKQYTMHPFLTIILLEPPVHFSLFPLSYLSNSLQISMQSFLSPILQLVHQSYQSTKLLSLEMCKKYITFDYQFWLTVYLMRGQVGMDRICYGYVTSQDEQMKCVSKVFKQQQSNLLHQQHQLHHQHQQNFNQERQLHINRVRKCWTNQVPKGLIVRNNKVKLKKQYFYADKIDQSTFGIQNNSKINYCNNTQQL